MPAARPWWSYLRIGMRGVLYLSGTKVGDAGLAHLRGLSNLRTLRVEDTMITDAGLRHLTRLHSLEYAGMLHTKVTHDGVQQLKKSLPRASIVSRL